MSECPTCGRKLKGSVCPYCDEEVLDDERADSTPVSGESLVTVFSCDQPRQADHVMSLLESEGIPAYQASGADLDDLQDDDEDIFGDITIKVDEDDADRAKEVIESAEHELEADEG
jgi:hypothetical protein